MNNKTKKLPTFKSGDRVWCILTGEWHVLEKSSHDEYPHRIPHVDSFTIDGKISLSHTNPVIFEKEQVLDIPDPKFIPEKGQLCWFWDDLPNKIVLRRFIGMRDSCGYYAGHRSYYQNCAPFNGELPEGVEL